MRVTMRTEVELLSYELEPEKRWGFGSRVNECTITAEVRWTLMVIYEICNRSVAHVPLGRGFSMCPVNCGSRMEERGINSE